MKWQRVRQTWSGSCKAPVAGRSCCTCTCDGRHTSPCRQNGVGELTVVRQITKCPLYLPSQELEYQDDNLEILMWMSAWYTLKRVNLPFTIFHFKFCQYTSLSRSSHQQQLKDASTSSFGTNFSAHVLILLRRILSKRKKRSKK